MTAIDFPASPTNGQSFTPATGITYRYVTPPGIWTVANGPVDTVIASDTPPSNPTPNQLWFHSGLASLYVYYDDGNSQQWVPAMPIPAPAPPGGGAVSVKFTKFIANGTWTPDAKLLFGEIQAKGGGGAGEGGTGAANAGWVFGWGGGGEGATAVKYFSSTGLSPTYTVTVAPTTAAAAAGVVGTNGAASSVGTLCVANGGFGGGTVAGHTGGKGGSTGTGDTIIVGVTGHNGTGLDVNGGYGLGGNGGGSGGGTGPLSTGIPQALPGNAATANTGGGGGGSSARQSATAVAGGAGGSGYVTIVEYLKA